MCPHPHCLFTDTHYTVSSEFVYTLLLISTNPSRRFDLQRDVKHCAWAVLLISCWSWMREESNVVNTAVYFFMLLVKCGDGWMGRKRLAEQYSTGQMWDLRLCRYSDLL